MKAAAESRLLPLALGVGVPPLDESAVVALLLLLPSPAVPVPLALALAPPPKVDIMFIIAGFMFIPAMAASCGLSPAAPKPAMPCIPCMAASWACSWRACCCWLPAACVPAAAVDPSTREIRPEFIPLTLPLGVPAPEGAAAAPALLFAVVLDTVAAVMAELLLLFSPAFMSMGTDWA